MKVKELKRWLNLYDDDLEFVVEVKDGDKFTPTVLRKSGNDLLFSKPYGLSIVDIIVENAKNVVISQGGKVSVLKNKIELKHYEHRRKNKGIGRKGSF